MYITPTTRSLLPVRQHLFYDATLRDDVETIAITLYFMTAGLSSDSTVEPIRYIQEQFRNAASAFMHRAAMRTTVPAHVEFTYYDKTNSEDVKEVATFLFEAFAGAGIDAASVMIDGAYPYEIVATQLMDIAPIKKSRKWFGGMVSTYFTTRSIDTTPDFLPEKLEDYPDLDIHLQQVLPEGSGGGPLVDIPEIAEPSVPPVISPPYTLLDVSNSTTTVSKDLVYLCNRILPPVPVNLTGTSVKIIQLTTDSNFTNIRGTEGDVLLYDTVSNGVLDTTETTTSFSFSSPDRVMFIGGELRQSCEDAIVIGKSSSPYEVLIENVNFTGTITRSAITIESCADLALITIRNCKFESIQNLLSLVNPNGSIINISIKDCVVEEFTSHDDGHAGLIKCISHGLATEQFSNVTIVIDNVTTPSGRVVMPADPADITGTTNPDQIMCVVGGDVLPYDATRFPAVYVR